MNIKLASDNFVEQFTGLFYKDDVSVLNIHDRNTGEPIDLLIFPGGADVGHQWYSSDPYSAESAFVDSQPNRDRLEFQIFEEVSDARLSPKKILGVCRGAQFLNVAMSGGLYEDMAHYGIGHKPGAHTIEHLTKNPLSDMVFVNSLHHQAIRQIGGTNRYNYNDYRTTIHAVEPKSKIVEIMSWANRILAIQFHPELYSENNSDREVFTSTITKWIEGEVKF